jgi:hypothetical protein
MNMSVSPKSLKSAKRLVASQLRRSVKTRTARRGKAKRVRQKSFYELYPMPFFKRETHDSWNVTPTGDYSKDCETGTRYALRFLETCDGTLGWSASLSSIIQDMIRKGPQGKTFADGDKSCGGLIVGFTSTIGKVLAIGLDARKTELISGAQTDFGGPPSARVSDLKFDPTKPNAFRKPTASKGKLPKPRTTVKVPADAHPNAIALAVADESISSRARKGEILLVEPVKPKAGEIAVYWLKGDPKPRVAVLAKDAFGWPCHPESECSPLICFVRDEPAKSFMIDAMSIERLERARVIPA